MPQTMLISRSWSNRKDSSKELACEGKSILTLQYSLCIRHHQTAQTMSFMRANKRTKSSALNAFMFRMILECSSARLSPQPHIPLISHTLDVPPSGGRI